MFSSYYVRYTCRAETYIRRKVIIVNVYCQASDNIMSTNYNTMFVYCRDETCTVVFTGKVPSTGVYIINPLTPTGLIRKYPPRVNDPLYMYTTAQVPEGNCCGSQLSLFLLLIIVKQYLTQERYTTMPLQVWHLMHWLSVRFNKYGFLVCTTLTINIVSVGPVTLNTNVKKKSQALHLYAIRLYIVPFLRSNLHGISSHKQNNYAYVCSYLYVLRTISVQCKECHAYYCEVNILIFTGTAFVRFCCFIEDGFYPGKVPFLQMRVLYVSNSPKITVYDMYVT